MLRLIRIRSTQDGASILEISWLAMALMLGTISVLVYISL